MNFKPFYTSSFFQSLASGLINPFIPVFAFLLGASKPLIGLTSTFPRLSQLFSQLIWGSLSEGIRSKKFLVFLGGVAWSLLWIPIASVENPIQLIILLTLQSFLGAVAIPAWTVLLIHSIPKYKRAEISGKINTVSGLGSFVGTMIAGFVLNKLGFVYFLFWVIALLGMVSKLLFLPLEEPTIPIRRQSLKERIKEVINFSEIKSEKKLKKLLFTIMFLNFAVGLPSPFFSVFVIEHMGGDKLDIAVISAMGTISAIMFYRAWGKLIDYLGRKTIMLSCIIPISINPFVYAVANNIIWLYIYAAINGMSWAGFNLAAFVYLSDTIPKQKSSSVISVYNILTGISSSISPFIGGLMAEFLSIRAVFTLSAFFRGLSIFFVDKLEERTGFKPKGLIKFGPEFFGLSYRIETFLSTYSLLFSEIKKERIKVIRNVRRIVLKL